MESSMESCDFQKFSIIYNICKNPEEVKRVFSNLEMTGEKNNPKSTFAKLKAIITLVKLKFGEFAISAAQR
jgi:hypothetical protein